MATVELKGVTKTYPNGLKAVDNLDLTIADGEFMVLVGPSGCGKTTALRMVAGLEDISDGTLTIGDRVVNHIGPKDRDIAMVFQNYGLYPHMTVAENIGFSLRIRKVSKPEIKERVATAASILGLNDYLDRKPAQLSGGQRQRVAMGRAIVREPAVFLMDEPLSNLDARLRVQMRAEVIRIHRRLGVATLYVTHDQIEAMTMGDRVAVIRGGVLQQVGTPQSLFDRPINVFVASFIGSPSMNLYYATLGRDRTELILGSQRVAFSPAVHAQHPLLNQYRGEEVIVGIRPEHLSLATAPEQPSFVADIELIEALGSELYVHFKTDTRAVTLDTAGAETEAEWHSTEESMRKSLGVARVSSRHKLRSGDTINLTFDQANLHFFDSVTGKSIAEETGTAPESQIV